VFPHTTSYMFSDDVSTCMERMVRIQGSVVAVRHGKTAGVCWYYVRAYVCESYGRSQLEWLNGIEMEFSRKLASYHCRNLGSAHNCF